MIVSAPRPVRLGVNIDHVATVRQARRGRIPDLLEAARVCARHGAQSIVCHLREDRRHIQDSDVRRLKRFLKLPLNLEMSLSPSVVKVAHAVGPAQVTLVPEKRQELTTEGGLDAQRLYPRLRPLVQRFARAGISVSLFVDPLRKQLRAAKLLEVPMVELHTGAYANARGAARKQALRALEQAAAEAQGMGLAVAAGHGLDYDNIGVIARIPQIEEVNIGFSIISRALLVGLGKAVEEMTRYLNWR